MQIIKLINPKRVFRPKQAKKKKVSRSEQSSFGSGTTSSSEDSTVSNQKTPKSVLPGLSGDWPSEISPDVPAVSGDAYYELTQALKLIDRDNDGLISKSELADLLGRLGAEPPSKEEVATMLMDVGEGGGCVSVEALASRLGLACEPAGDEDLRETFNFFDTDHDGKITAEELLRVFQAIGDERCTLGDCRRMIAEVGKNGDGFVCFEDFSRMMVLQR